MLVNESDARIKELLGLITQGKWAVNEDGRLVFCPDLDLNIAECNSRALFPHDNRHHAEFIALARNRIGPLLEERELNESLAELEHEITKGYKKQLAQSQFAIENLTAQCVANSKAQEEALADFESLKVAHAMNMSLANETQQMVADELAQAQTEIGRLREASED